MRQTWADEPTNLEQRDERNAVASKSSGGVTEEQIVVITKKEMKRKKVRAVDWKKSLDGPSLSESAMAKKFVDDLAKKIGHKDLTIFRHVNIGTHGVPDYSLTLYGTTLWLEFKRWMPGRRPHASNPQKKHVRNMTLSFFVIFLEEVNGTIRVCATKQDPAEVTGTQFFSWGEELSFLRAFLPN